MQDVKAPAGEGRIGDVLVANDKLADGRRWSGQMQPAPIATEQWRNGLRHGYVRKSNRLA
jgi:hypothetical protein